MDPPSRLLDWLDVAYRLGVEQGRADCKGEADKPIRRRAVSRCCARPHGSSRSHSTSVGLSISSVSGRTWAKLARVRHAIGEREGHPLGRPSASTHGGAPTAHGKLHLPNRLLVEVPAKVLERPKAECRPRRIGELKVPRVRLRSEVESGRDLLGDVFAVLVLHVHVCRWRWPADMAVPCMSENKDEQPNLIRRARTP